MALKEYKTVLIKQVNTRLWNDFKKVCDLKEDNIGDSINALLKEYTEKMLTTNKSSTLSE